jgi:hypothetical protein
MTSDQKVEDKTETNNENVYSENPSNGADKNNESENETNNGANDDLVQAIKNNSENDNTPKEPEADEDK